MTMHKQNSTWSQYRLYLLILTIGIVLRVFGWNSYDLWFDEIGTNLFSSGRIHQMAELSNQAPGEMFVNRIKNDPHSPAYYGLVFFFSLFAADGQGLRWISILFSIGALIVFYRLARLFFERATSLMALLLLSVNPFHIWYAQEARAYAMATFFTLLMMYLFFRAVNDRSSRWWIGYGLAGVASIFTSYYAVFLILVSGLYLWPKQRRDLIKPWLLMSTFIVGAFMLSMPVLANQVSYVQHDFWLPRPSWIMLLFTWLIFDLGYSAYVIQYSIGLVLFFVLFGWGAYLQYQKDRSATLTLVSLLVLPLILVCVISYVIMPVYINRQLLIFSPFYYLFIAHGIVSIKARQERIMIVVCVLVLSMISIVNYHRNHMLDHWARSTLFTGVTPKKNYANLLQLIRENFQPGDLIAVTDTQGFVMMFDQLISRSASEAGIKFDDVTYLMYPQFLQPYDIRFLQVKDIVARMEFEGGQMYAFDLKPEGNLDLSQIPWEEQQFNRVWLLSVSWFKDDEQFDLGLNSQHVQNYFQTRYRKRMFKKKDGVYLELFEHNKP